MQNILSYASSNKIKGKVIKEWIKFHTENQTEYTKEAKKMLDYLNISDDAYYKVCKGNYQASERQFCVIKC